MSLPVEDVRQERIEQLQNELALAQYEAQKWREKYLVEKRRRQKTARDLLDLVARTGRNSNGGVDPFGAGGGDKSSSLFGSLDHMANLLSPTLSSFDFDDDSSEDGSDEADACAPGTPPSLVEATRYESEIGAEGNDGKLEPMNGRNVPYGPSIALELRDRESLMHHLNETAAFAGRSNRSLTTGSALEAFGGPSQSLNGGESEHLVQRNLMYRIMHAKPITRDLWQARAHPNKQQHVARSIMFSTHLKKEHIFERFFVTGMVLSETEQQHQPLGFAGFWKPKILYNFPNRPNDLSDESIADFCFPRGVPLVMCTPDQVASIRGVPVSKWFTEIEPLQEHIEQTLETAGYTFRLTGAKGEVLYGFCAVIMREVAATDEFPGVSCQKSPRSGSTLDESSTSPSSREDNMQTMRKMAPMCYCFTAKFPFYRFHFALLRMIIDNELEQCQLLSTASKDGLVDGAREDDEFEIILRPQLELSIDFAIFHEETFRMKEQSSDAKAKRQTNLTSIASKLDISPVNRRVFLSEDASVHVGKHDDGHMKTEAKKPLSQLRKSLSTDDISSNHVVNEWITDKPMVKTIGLDQPKEYERIQVGDILEAVDSIATVSMSFEQTLTLLEKGKRPMRLRFRRTKSSTQTSPSASKRSAHSQFLSNTSVDILHRARRIKMNDPGQWSTARFPTFDFSYQFPKRHSDRWSIGVVLRFLMPDKVVEILACLLLEKQVVIMSDSPAKVSAVCTALLLLLSPFRWQSTYIPLLPAGLLDFLHSPVPFLVGCHSLGETSEWSDVCFYDIDRDRIAVPAKMKHLGPSSVPNGVELCRLLRKAKERFSALRPLEKPWHELSDEEDTIITLTQQEAEILLCDLGFDLSSHDLAASISGDQSFYDRLQEEVAKEVRNSIYEDYLDEFTQTQLFCQYYESLLHPEAPK